MSSQNSKTFTQSLESVQRRSEDLYQAAHSGYSQMPLMLADYLRELRSALEELQLAEEELKQQNLSLQAERLHYQDLFEFAPDGYLITDIQGTIQEVNQAATVLFRISAQGFPLIQFISEEDRASFRSVLEQLPMINRVQEWEILLRRETGERFKAALTVETVRQEGTAIALRWLIRDITLRKEIEAIQLQNLQLVEFERITNQFMATISHELRTPMNAISGFSQLLLSRVEHFDDPQLALMVERIARNSQCLLRLIEELLDFPKLKAKRLELRIASFDLVQVAIATLNELQPLADQKEIQLEFRTNLPDFLIVSDVTRLRQILVNLLSNAIKFTHHGTVALELFALPAGRMVILVRDTGIGIAPQDQAYIFREFWQLNQTTTREAKGTGLGLAIVKALVELMQGTIQVESEIGQGSTFRVELPRWISPV